MNQTITLKYYYHLLIYKKILCSFLQCLLGARQVVSQKFINTLETQGELELI